MSDHKSGNGDLAFRNQLELRIETLKARGSGDRRENTEAEVATLQALLDIHRQVTEIRRTTQKVADISVKFPSLLWLIVKRPLSTIPYLMASFVGLSALYISDIRRVILSEWNLPPDLFDLSAAQVVPVFFLLIVIGFMAEAKYRREEG